MNTLATLALAFYIAVLATLAVLALFALLVGTTEVSIAAAIALVVCSKLAPDCCALLDDEDSTL